MISLLNIKKDYRGANVVHALKGINLAFRKNEFVAILGPSGGGKTTLLNIIGGLDHCTSGDLIINGKSTKNFKDRDWDSYRNHSVGFVFQSYNLIPHQSVLANVELALTISGISAKEKKQKAIDALTSVGLKDQINKKPNQLSGGQMQRVAIARALVNNPDILLADEPTGALDSETSVQIMDIIKEIAKDRLVVMVTHNPDLAEEYANRIIRISDGNIVSDSNPYELQETEETFKAGKTVMNFFTALVLSFNNLLTKKGRTILTSFAGSIGIIGIALILALSTGVNNYIDEVQENSLSSYPLSIDSSSTDFSSAMLSMMSTVENLNIEEGKLTEVQIVSGMFNNVKTNNLKLFKQYLQENEEAISPLLNSTQYSYGIDLQIYSSDTENGIVQLNPSTLFSSAMSSYSSYSYSGAFQEMIDNQELLESQYEVIAGQWPQNYDECILVVQDKNTVTDYFMYSIGLRDPQELKDLITDIYNGKSTTIENEPISISYEEVLKLSFKVVNPSAYYAYNSTYDIWEDMSDDSEFMKKLIDESLDLKVVGIVTAKEGVSSTALSSGVAYTSDLTKYMINKAAESEIVKKQLENTEKDVFTNKTFEEVNDENKNTSIDFSQMISVDSNAISSAFSMNISQNDIATIVNNYMNSAMDIDISTDDLSNDLSASFLLYFSGSLNKYIEEKGTLGIAMYDMEDIAAFLQTYEESEECLAIANNLKEKYQLETTYSLPLFNQITQSVLENYYYMMQESSMLQNDKALLNADAVELLATSVDTSEVQNSISAFAEQIVKGQIQVKIAAAMSGLSTELVTKMAASMNVDAEKIASAFQFNMDEEEMSRILSTYMNQSSSEKTLKENLKELGYADLDEPSSISFYFKDFDCKEQFKTILSEYNDTMEENGEEENTLVYQDITGILMSSITTIINAISYILIAFVSVSLIVSSIMIAIITYISVLERTKEIGILRSLGASKHDVRHVFNAETFIIGLLSGLIGVLSTIVLCIPINKIVRAVTGIATITAELPQQPAIILVIISVVLTMLAGLIPANMASKCDPVIALRNE